MNIRYSEYKHSDCWFVLGGFVLFFGLLPSFTLPQWLRLSTIITTSTPTSIVAPPSDTTDCTVATISNTLTDFVPVVQCRFEHPGIITYQPPMFADIDGDGETEIVVILDHSPNGFAVVDPISCQAEHIVDAGEDMWLKDGGLVLGDVDANGRADVFIPAGTRIQRWEYDPQSQTMKQIWETAPNVAQAERAHLDIYDLNQDGEPELIPNIGRMVNAVTGQVYGGEVPALNQQGKGLFAFTADAIPEPAPDGWGNVELLFGTQIWRYNFRDQYWAKERSLPGFEHWGRDACVSIADMDLDGDVDAVVTHYDEAYTGEAVIWDLQTETILGGDSAWDYPNNKGSRMNISNLDDDPYPEMVMTSRFTIFAVDDIVNSGGFGNIIWLDQTTDESGHTQLTSFDFDGNGTYEIAYRDETHLRVFNGLGNGIPSGNYPSSAQVLLNTGEFNSCQSFTGMEYPTIGDVDQDGEAEMVATCGGYLSVYESGSLPWRNATRVWNTQAFVVTNVNQDGTIPAVMTENYTVFNNFLAQVTSLDGQDSVRIAVPDALATIREIRQTCGVAMEIEVEICNQGAAALPANTPFAVYQQDPTATTATLVQLNKLEESLTEGACTTVTLYGLPSPALDQPIHYYIVVNDNGQVNPPYVLDTQANGGAFPVTSIRECNYLNNMTDSLITGVAGATSELDTTICAGEIVYVGGFAYAETGTYTHVIPTDAGCDSLVTLHLVVTPAATSYLASEICAGTSFTYFDGQVFDTPGTYYDTLTAANGCDSIAILELSALPELNTEIEAGICVGERYIFAGNELTQTGRYVDSLVAQTGCDSIVTLQLTVSDPTPDRMAVTICENTSYTFGGNELTEAGTYTDTLQNGFGCDSIITLDLDISTSISTVLEEQFCTGSGYLFNGQWLTTAGVYTARLTSVNGCDSNVVLNLFTFPTFQLQEQATICQGETYILGEQRLTQGGYYAQTFTTRAGCDSTVFLSLDVIGTTYQPAEQTICEGETIWIGGQEIGEAGQYLDTLTAANTGCDSIVYLQLSITPSTSSDFAIDLCAGDSYDWNGTAYNSTGTYTQTLAAANGCDSIVTLNLQVAPDTIVSSATFICEGTSYDWGNLALTEAGEYTQTFTSTAGCDSTVQLQLTVVPDVKNEIVENICAGDSYDWNGRFYTESGTYEQVFSSANNCDSTVTLQLFVLPNQRTQIDDTTCEGHPYTFGEQILWVPGTYQQSFVAANGCDSIVELSLSFRRNTATIAQETICEGEQFAFGTRELTTAGEYIDTLVAANGCDSFAVVQLSVLPTPDASAQAVICAGEEYIFDGRVLTETGTYERVVVGENGCAGVVSLALEVLPRVETSLQQEICAGEVFIFNGQEVTERGIYEMTSTAANGCDSITYLELLLLEDSFETIQPSICAGSSFQIGNNSWNQTGTYTLQFTAANGCDSLLTVELTVEAQIEQQLSARICDGESYTVGGNNYTTSGQYTDTLQATNGCDSIVLLTLDVLPNVTTSETQTICAGEQYTWNGQVYQETGVYEQQLLTAAGCDSVVTIELTVLPVLEQFVSVTLCAGETYNLAGNIYETAGTYIDTLSATTGCDSIIQLEIIQIPNIELTTAVDICQGESFVFGSQTLTTPGRYTQVLNAQSGCDSTVILLLTVNDAVKTTFNETICLGEQLVVDGRVYDQTGIYEERFLAASGCDSIVTLQLRVLDVDTLRTVADVCAGRSYKFYDQLYTEPGTYQTQIPNENGCSNIAILELTELPLNATAIAADICQGDTYHFGAKEWSTTGIYFDTLVAANLCDSIVRLRLTVHESTEEMRSLSICEGDSVFIAGAYRNESDFFEENLLTVNGCDSIIYTDLVVVPNVAIEVYGGEICAGDSIQIGVQGASEYEWFPKTGLSCVDCPNPTVAPNRTTTYTVRAQGCLGEILEEQVTVFVSPVPNIVFSSDQEIVVGQQTTLRVTTDAVDPLIYWRVNDKIFCADCPSITVNPTEDTPYLATVETSAGCVIEQEILVTVRRECEETDFFIPNIISPNGDGANDEFYIRTDIPTDLKHLRIYDRWGEMMFQTSDWQTHWRGDYRGQAVNPGVYVYYLEAVCPNGELYKKVGNITVLK